MSKYLKTFFARKSSSVVVIAFSRLLCRSRTFPILRHQMGAGGCRRRPKVLLERDRDRTLEGVLQEDRVKSTRSEAPEHKASHTKLDVTFTRRNRSLEFLCQKSEPIQPTERSFHNPSNGNWLETFFWASLRRVIFTSIPVSFSMRALISPR